MSYTYPLYRKWRHTSCIVRFDGFTSGTVVVADSLDPVGRVLNQAPDHDNTHYWEPLTPLQLASLLVKENHGT